MASTEPTATSPLLDPAEIAHFGRLSAEWWDPKGKFAALHAIGPARGQFIRRMAEITLKSDPRSLKPFAGLAVLDVGCGGGLVTEPLARLGGRVTAIDPAPESIAVARSHAAEQGLSIDYRLIRLEDVIAEGRTFDLVTCLEVLEHIPDPAGFLALLARVVRPGGLLVLSTINRTAASFALAIVAAEYVLGMVPRGTHQWSRLIRPDELERWIAEAGLSSLGTEGIVLDPLSGTWRLAADTRINYLAAAVKR
jgi:2-polyprenyl-6-hydroxyphenyl methylase/3-demethylubiquinone-9 3-methyltransferase